MCYMLQLVSHRVEMQNLKVDTCIYRTDNTVAVKKRPRETAHPPASHGINTQICLGYLGSL